MRQAGRYLPEYNATRAKAGSFLALAKTPSLATEVTLQPLDRFPLDAAILFSDILTVPDAMGLGLHFAEGEGPAFERTDRATRRRSRALEVPDMAKLRYVFDAVREIKRALGGRVPLIGFAGSPFTLACYMIEGAGSADFATVRRMAYGRPDLLRRLVDVNARAVAAYLDEQIEAGADAVMLFDTWGGLLDVRRLSLVLARLHALGPGRVARRAGRQARADDRVHEGRRAMARFDRGLRRRVRGARLDGRLGRRAPARRQPGRAAGQSRPAGASRGCARDRPRGDGHRPGRGPGAGTRLQSRPRHRSRDASRPRRAADRNGPPRITCDARGGPLGARSPQGPRSGRGRKSFRKGLDKGDLSGSARALIHT